MTKRTGAVFDPYQTQLPRHVHPVPQNELALKDWRRSRRDRRQEPPKTPKAENKLNRSTLAALMIPSVLLLSACSPGDGEFTPADAGPASSPASSTPMETGEDRTVEGKTGYRHGLDCGQSNGPDDCAINFTLESLEELDSCDGNPWGTAPIGTTLMKATVLVEANHRIDGYDPETFTSWSEWSARTSDGLNQSLPQSDSCQNFDHNQAWSGRIQLGDTERRIHYMDVPEGATEIRLTETLNSARWTFTLPESLSTGATPAPTPPSSAAEISAPAQTTPPTSTFSPQPSPAPAVQPVIGFTGAPGVDPIRVLDKTISHCGSQMHEIGTTFFTDGTSGWTESCSAQMLDQP